MIINMPKLLVIYSTSDGQTQKIADFIANEIRENYEKVTIININDIKDVNINEYSHIIIGASIRYGKFSKAIYSFIDDTFAILNSKKTAFYSVNLTARKFDKNTPETNSYTRKFLARIQWKPKKCAVFAGALVYPQYKLLDKYMIKLIMKITKGETDTTKSIDYTDWLYVKTWARDFAEKLK
ncbi:menaquinone-dependent protoporphyrinogen IX dehydrogenase [Thorsellia kenyensis]|uniref:Protoporphyrinogen IX dehydrogenase [quinone] n=1 Tax=Thorsellia kenyensis TaxID=1549888 RepID=A0ABV6CBY1_9GAMM